MTRAAVCVFALVFVIHSLSPALTSGDSRWTVLVALSLLDRGDTNLDEYRELIRANDYYGVECVTAGGSVLGPAMGDCADGHLYNWYPVGVPVLAAPFVLGIRSVLRLAAPLLTRLAPFGDSPILEAFLRADLVAGRALAEMIVASFIVAFTAALISLTAGRFLPAKAAAGLALIFAFATPAWSTASRSLYQHGPSMLMIAVTIHLLVAAQRTPSLAPLAGLTASLAYAVRPTNLLFLAVVTGYIVHRRRRQFPAYAACALSVLAAFAAYNLSAFGTWLPSYYTLRPPPPDTLEGAVRVLEALAGNLISPSRGLLLFTPVFLFSAAGTRLAFRSGWLKPLPAYLTGLAALHLLFISLYVSSWWGGHSYGPRLASDMTPALIFLLIPVFLEWRQRGWRSTPAQVVFVGLLAASTLIHARGALCWKAHTWNTVPVNVDQHPERLWDWSDPQFLRGW